MVEVIESVSLLRVKTGLVWVSGAVEVSLYWSGALCVSNRGSGVLVSRVSRIFKGVVFLTFPRYQCKGIRTRRDEEFKEFDVG
jgi:hypothetical protein